ncbi:MAG: hypothetical protein KDB53_04680, partial [Planctomycetes bacterium]|nr:hypothetical protein [Planctomycetota bacterium]
DLLIVICNEHLRDTPLVFPAAKGQKLDLDRAILQADRNRVERLLGEIYAGRKRFEYSVIVARSHYRATGDACDLVRFLSRAGRDDEALDMARRVLRRPDAPRHAQLRVLYENLVSSRQAARQSVLELRRALLQEPSVARFCDFRDQVAPEHWDAERRELLAELREGGIEADRLFELYLACGDILEADGLVVTQAISPRLLAEAADQVIEEHPQEAAGWLIVAAHRLMKSAAKRSYYQTAAGWLSTVRRVSAATGQDEAFGRALASFRDRYRRRTALMTVLEEHGL